MMMGANTALEVQGIWKKFARNHRAKRRFVRESLAVPLLGRSGAITLNEGEFWALRDVSFELSTSESIALLGLNGSGKSTLLSVLAGLTYPDKGRVASLGKVAAFINLSSGLKPSLTGLENISVRGAMRGKSREQISASVDEIIEFAELGPFINAPVATYSSGMKMRLGFSIAIHDEPDILLVDEVLSVGDFRFKQKCLNRIQTLRDNCCFVLVSHSMSDVSRFCDKAIVLGNGRMNFSGPVDEAIKTYLNSQEPTEAPEQPKAHAERTFYDEAAIGDVQCEFTDNKGQATNTINVEDGFKLAVTFTAKKKTNKLILGIPIHTDSGEVLTAFSSEFENLELDPKPGERVTVRLDVPSLGLNPGTYNLILSIVDGPQFLYREVIISFTVRPTRALYWGAYTTDASWERLS